MAVPESKKSEGGEKLSADLLERMQQYYRHPDVRHGRVYVGRPNTPSCGDSPLRVDRQGPDRTE